MVRGCSPFVYEAVWVLLHCDPVQRHPPTLALCMLAGVVSGTLPGPGEEHTLARESRKSLAFLALPSCIPLGLEARPVAPTPSPLLPPMAAEVGGSDPMSGRPPDGIPPCVTRV